MIKQLFLWMRYRNPGLILKMSKVSMAFLVSVFTLLSLNSQTIQGLITDSDNGEPIIGATVLEKGTDNNGTTTDFDGKFQWTAQADNPVLGISHVGYQPMEGSCNNEAVREIQLKRGLALVEIVVTALGIEREKKALGYSVQEIGGPSLVVARENNVANAISGKIAGLQVIRGSNGPAGS